jgi:hypothetical protein
MREQLRMAGNRLASNRAIPGQLIDISQEFSAAPAPGFRAGRQILYNRPVCHSVRVLAARMGQTATGDGLSWRKAQWIKGSAAS